jgi:hypothetical protein
MRLSSDAIGGTIQYFTWNPMVPSTFAYIDGHGLVSSFEIDFNSKQLKSLGQSDANDDNSSSKFIRILRFRFDWIFAFL